MLSGEHVDYQNVQKCFEPDSSIDKSLPLLFEAVHLLRILLSFEDKNRMCKSGRELKEQRARIWHSAK